MSHPSQRQFVELVVSKMPRYFNDVKVLEVGSFDINGSVRVFFENCDYIGLDVAEGKGVDVVCQGQMYDAPSDTFDHAISCEAMEHNPYWVETFENMIRLTRPGGLITMTCATTGRVEHGTTRTLPHSSPLTVDLRWDYYKNLTGRDFEKRIRLKNVFSSYKFWTNWSSSDLYFCGIKSGSNENTNAPEDWEGLVKAVDELVANAKRKKRVSYRALAGHLLGETGFKAVRKLRNN